MNAELLVLIAMMALFAIAVFIGKYPIGISLALASIAGALLSGFGVPFRHLVEGSISYLDPILIIVTAMIFMEIIKETGALGETSRLIVRYFHAYPFLFLTAITFFIMIPGMLTGLSTASVLTTGAVVAPALIAYGIPKVKTGSIIAMAALYGMIAPPINVPAMIIGGGVDMPFIGFELPLLFATVPLALFTTYFIARPHVSRGVRSEVLEKISALTQDIHRARLFLPVLVLVLLMSLSRLIPNDLTSLGLPLIFVISSLAAFRSGRDFNYWKVAQSAIKKAMPVMGILVGIGMFIQILSLSGVRGFLIVNIVQIPSYWIYVAIAVSLPLFGAISSYGASYVLGVPFLLALLGRNEIIVASAITLIASLGDMMPPTALAGIFSAQVVDEPNYFRILKVCIPYIVITAFYGVMMIIGANWFAKYLIV
ncbi:MAG: TRAP transporter large permease subunit [Candidatus Marinimicrobia bacterium]|nr:TRAP transporter large permease subunit [Candidatus Neomarinimicrobiota bacterium]